MKDELCTYWAKEIIYSLFGRYTNTVDEQRRPQYSGVKY